MSREFMLLTHAGDEDKRLISYVFLEMMYENL